MKKYILYISFLCILTQTSNAQVTIRKVKEPTIQEKGYFNQSFKAKEITVSELSLKSAIAREASTSVRGLIRSSHLLDTAISLTTFAKWEEIEKNSVTRIKISASRVPSLQLYFRRLTLPERAEMYIYDAGKTTILGPITNKENGNKNQLWGTNIFEGNSVIVEIKVPTELKSKLSINVAKILFGISTEERNKRKYNVLKDSLTTEHFDESGPCNVNILCAAGSGFDVERRAVALILMPDGACCSGFMVNDVCNSRTPYLMTAYHATTGRDPGDWQYIFHYWSPQCSPNQDGSYSLLFNGATLKSTWIETDFSLLQLDDQPPINSGITYLGWSRSSTAATSSVCISHPYGDVMKIATDNSGPSVGNIQGYSNTGWRNLYDDGAVEPGSSGSPMLDQNRRAVGQLYSNTQPTTTPCNTQTGGSNFGRFDISWDGGGTSSTRLKDWLDPNNVSPTTLNTFDPLNQYVIVGADVVCTSEGYSLSSLPSNVTFNSWSISPGTSASLSSSGTSATVTNVNGGPVTLSASVTNACSSTFNITKNLTVGTPTVTFDIAGYPYTDPECHEVGGFYTYRASLATGTPGTWLGYDWGWRNLTTSGVSTDPTIYGVDYTFMPPDPGTYEIWVKPTNGCGSGVESKITVTAEYFCWLMRSSNTSLSVYPNPVQDVITVNATGIESKMDKDTDKGSMVVIELFESLSATKVKEWKFVAGQKSYSLPVKGLQKGTYYLRYSTKKRVETVQVIINP